MSDVLAQLIFPSSEQIKAAWQKCEDAWQAAGAIAPCYEEKYMKAREELAALHEARKKFKP